MKKKTTHLLLIFWPVLFSDVVFESLVIVLLVKIMNVGCNDAKSILQIHERHVWVMKTNSISLVLLSCWLAFILQEAKLSKDGMMVLILLLNTSAKKKGGEVLQQRMFMIIFYKNVPSLSSM
ncbi:hypothetical protein K7X08_037904 [Anisodus acutangulus]|uniref:Uncharacterized protein n=1 Tax=Anisodus acutangulus TaxID=402998 RepID=A0A9Q1N176_9SOLA|nr:hypothetical protein K7X08_037904 [Anisodus acutangulus]